jgi:membrane-associated phospholipid phosphatase
VTSGTAIEVTAGVEERRTSEPLNPFLAWPGWAHLRYAAALSLANALWFAFVYGGADSLTAHRSLRVPVHFAAELRIPFVPAMTVFYMSLYILFLLAPFVLRTRREFRAVIWTLAVVIACAGMGFLAFPAELAFAPPREDELGVWAGLFHLADRLNLTYNLLPSLHVAMGVVCVAVFSPRSPAVGKIILWSWAVLIAASTVLIHQHHVLDVVTGWLLAVGGVRTVFRTAVEDTLPGPRRAE